MCNTLEEARKASVITAHANHDCHLHKKILGMRSRGAPIGTSVVIDTATRILMKHKKVTATGSSYQLINEWAKSILWGVL